MNNNVTINNNDLLENSSRKTTKGVIKMSKLIADNILADYQMNGVRDSSISIFCGDMYYLNHDIAKKFSKGEIMKINDVVQINDKNNKSLYQDNTIPVYYRVTGRKIEYKGQPLITLDLQEIK